MSDNEHQERFDEDYYYRYYSDPSTRVSTPSYYRCVARFVAAYCDYIDIPVTRILDLGCGTGELKSPLEAEFRKATYLGVERSRHACEKYGWENDCASTFWAPEPFDLVVCHDVLQYLDDKLANVALANFSTLTSQALYFSVLTQEDWDHHVDQRLTDNDVFLRSADWYRKRLRKQFRNLGGGMYLLRSHDSVVYALEGDV